MTEPSEKSPGVERLLDKVAKYAFGRPRKETIQQSKCVTCGKPATEFRDALSRKEYTISGMCQECQNSVFG